MTDKIALFNKCKKIVEDKGWEMISTEYIQSKILLEIKCDKEHLRKKELSI